MNLAPTSISAGASKRPIVEGEFLFTDEDFRRVSAMLHADSGIYLPDSKAALVYSRLAKRVRSLGLESFRDYCELIAGSDGASERQAMLAALTTNVTRFFREPHHFDHLRDHLLPELIDEARAGGRVRLWSAGCSTGQEPYSMALTVLAAFPDAARYDFRILATDIDPVVLKIATTGIYSPDAVAAIPAQMRHDWLERVGGEGGEPDWRVRGAARDLIAFRELNLNGPWPIKGRFQVIFCRNVAIYFEESTQERIWERFGALMTERARLYIGHSERVTDDERFQSDGLTVYRLKGRGVVSRVRVLVVDDSATMRALITAALERDPCIEVCGTAGDALEARQAIKALNPDVVTLDIEMPNMNGLDFLEKIMRLRPMPVIMVSTQTQAGAAATLEALEIGALDCVAKPTAGAGLNGFSDLAEKIKAAATARVRPRGETAPIQAPRRGFRNNGRVIAIGASTGGVEALLTVLAEFPADCPPTVVVQHMPASFTHSFAQRLNRACAARVSEAVDGDLLTPGRIYIAPGGEHHLEVAGAASPRCRLVEGAVVSGHRPSVDRLFNAVAASVGEHALGIVLTGMGRDGAQGLLALRSAGARTLGQDEASSVIYGMPKAAFDVGAVERRLPLRKIASAALDICAADQAEAS